VSASTARAAAIFALVVAAASPAAARAAPDPGAVPSASPSGSPAASDGPLVVVDAGHGGDKTGAKTRAGVNEKDVTLAVARAAKAKLEALGFRVIMTRDDDVDVKLADRILRANRERAAVFVSIHANWSPVPSRSGVETYILSADASDEDAQAVLHLENDEGEADTGGGKRADGGDLSFILGDLERTQAHQDAAKLAKAVQAAVSGVKGLGPSRGLRQAPFLVLRGAEMPAILVELGYLSNAAQGALLAGEATQQAAGEAVARGVAAFAKARRSTR
jgi:N-acetylmuramoyl-L-alanine amidase